VLYLVASSYRRLGDALFRSADDGRRWKRVATPRGSQFFSVSFPSPREGVLGDDAGRFFATHDAGRTWTMVHGRGQDLRTFAFLTPSHGLALSPVPDYALYETRNGGRSWHPYTATRLERPLGFTTLGGNHIWIADVPACPPPGESCPGAIVRSADDGRTWQRIELNLVPNELTLDFVTPSIGYAPAAPFSPYRTKDGGRTWTIVGSPYAVK
jgi:photosystem II stability/assembly factor-like uncharacterized protein